jgi:hypothetical protein
MANDDSADLQSTLSDYELLEHFAMVLVYFEMYGRSWLDQARFLAPLNTCSWNSTDVNSTIGVGCNEKDSFVRLYLSNFPDHQLDL